MSLDELGQLTLTAGSDPEGSALLHRDRIDPATFIGKGQAKRLQQEATAADVDVVVFDNALSPVQQRNLQEIFGRMDRLDGPSSHDSLRKRMGIMHFAIFS